MQGYYQTPQQQPSIIIGSNDPSASCHSPLKPKSSDRRVVPDLSSFSSSSFNSWWRWEQDDHGDRARLQKSRRMMLLLRNGALVFLGGLALYYGLVARDSHFTLPSTPSLSSSSSSSASATAESSGSDDSMHTTIERLGNRFSSSILLASTQAHAGLQLPTGYGSAQEQLLYEHALHHIDWHNVEADIKHLLTSSQDFWPADYGTYGGLLIRLSWHACGSYRLSDGRGGCEGGAQRFDPERSWPDNTNLDKARRLLEPIKLKYGVGLSWGDLIAFAGTVAIRSMGGPHIGFCAGRIDVLDNSQTRALGPSMEQEQFAQCPVNGACPHPLGQNTLGLIYVNPEGPMGQPDPVGAAATIRDVFGRMDWSGRDLVALIGGGHTFGKAHGASAVSPGENPGACPFASWNGPKGMHAITSGFEGPWTSHPTQWDNHYFSYLVEHDWEVVQSPAGHWQWKVQQDELSPRAPVADPAVANATQAIMMLTTDMALKMDPEYNSYLHEFAANITLLEERFAYVWYKLVTRDMGPIERCVGPHVPPPQHWQNALPKSPPWHQLANMDHVREDLHTMMTVHNSHSHQSEFVRLAYQCAITYRATDYSGGCNGGRIRFAPGKDWPVNAGLDVPLSHLQPIKDKYGEGVSFADLIVLAGNVAAEILYGAPPLSFCPGRVDDTTGLAWKHLKYGNTDFPTTVEALLEMAYRRGQTAHDVVALSFIKLGGSAKQLRHLLERSSSDYGNNNVTVTTGSNIAEDEDSILMKGLIYYPELRIWAEYYASADNEVFGDAFRKSWTKLMNADRFDGPVRNLCPML